MSLGNKANFYKRMLALAIPIALQQLLTSCAQLVDTAMVVGLGNASTAAIGVAGRWGFLINLALFGVSSGVATMTAQHWGIKDVKSIHRAYGFGLFIALIIGIIYGICTFTIPDKMMMVFTDEKAVIEQGVSYLQNVSFYGIFLSISLVTSTSMRSTEDVHTPLVCAAASVLTNTGLNYLLISGHLGFPALGLKGAAIATTTSMLLQVILLFAIGYIKKNILFSNLNGIFSFDKIFIQKFLKVCIPVTINELMWGVGTNVYSMVYARQGSENYAAYTISDSIQQIAFVFFVGICSACSIMIGKSVGAGKTKEAYSMGKRFIFLVPLMGLLIGSILIFVRYPLLNLLPIETQDTLNTAAKILLIYSLWIPLRNIPYVCIVGIFRAGGDTKTGMLLDIGALFMISIPVVSYLGFFTDIAFTSLIAAMYIAEDSLKIILCIFRFKSRKWIKQLTFAGDNPSD